MRKIVILLALALVLPGCANLQRALDVANLTTASINNPVTPTMLYDMENGVIIAVAALNAYRQACIQATIPPSCKTVIRSIQVYTRQIPPLLVSLRAFVRNNDHVNAAIVYNAVANLISALKTTAAQNNVMVP